MHDSPLETELLIVYWYITADSLLGTELLIVYRHIIADILLGTELLSVRHIIADNQLDTDSPLIVHCMGSELLIVYWIQLLIVHSIQIAHWARNDLYSSLGREFLILHCTQNKYSKIKRKVFSFRW